MTALSPADIRKARAYLQGQGVRTSDIDPRRFAASAKETGKGFAATLKLLARLLSGGQGAGQARIATAGRDRTDPMRAIAQPTPSQELEMQGADPDEA